MPQTKLDFPETLPRTEELLKAIKEAFPIDAKLSSENCIDIDHGVISCTIDLSDKVIVVNTEKEAMSIKMLLLSVTMGLVAAVALFFVLGSNLRTSLGLAPLLVILFGSFVIVGFIIPAQSSPNQDKFHDIIVNYLKETYRGKQ